MLKSKSLKNKKEAHQNSVAHSRFCLFPVLFLCTPVIRLSVPMHLRFSLVCNVFQFLCFCSSLVLRFASACFFHFCWLQILLFGSQFTLYKLANCFLTSCLGFCAWVLFENRYSKGFLSLLFIIKQSRVCLLVCAVHKYLKSGCTYGPLFSFLQTLWLSPNDDNAIPRIALYGELLVHLSRKINLSQGHYDVFRRGLKTFTLLIPLLVELSQRRVLLMDSLLQQDPW